MILSLRAAQIYALGNEPLQYSLDSFQFCCCCCCCGRRYCSYDFDMIFFPWTMYIHGFRFAWVLFLDFFSWYLVFCCCWAHTKRPRAHTFNSLKRLKQFTNLGQLANEYVRVKLVFICFFLWFLNVLVFGVLIPSLSLGDLPFIPYKFVIRVCDTVGFVLFCFCLVVFR